MSKSRTDVQRAPLARPVLERSYPFEMRATGNGQTLEGYAAVFNTPARINSWEGHFDEVILPGAFRASIERSIPRLMFEHGKHPLIGNMPLGPIEEISEDTRGLYIRARLSDNWLIQPVRDAIRDKAVSGMSFRMVSASIVDKWQHRQGTVDLRTISEIDVPELGPVVFPAYEPTTVSVRSAMDTIGRALARDHRAVPDDASFNDVKETVCDALCQKLALPDYVYLWIVDLSDTWAIYNLGEDYFKVAYEMDDAGAVSFSGDPAAVEQVTTWVADTDETNSAQQPHGEARATDPTGQPDARSAGDGDGTPGNDGEPVTPAAPTPAAAQRDRELRMKGIIR